MGIRNVNVLDERHLFKHIKGPITLTRSAVDNGEGEGVSMLENQERGHGKKFINFACDIGKCRAGIGVSFESDGEKEIGLIDTLINA